jgi:hypothetical protein
MEKCGLSKYGADSVRAKDGVITSKHDVQFYAKGAPFELETNTKTTESSQPHWPVRLPAEF